MSLCYRKPKIRLENLIEEIFSDPLKEKKIWRESDKPYNELDTNVFQNHVLSPLAAKRLI